jgi:hypothetical protein
VITFLLQANGASFISNTENKILLDIGNTVSYLTPSIYRLLIHEQMIVSSS